MKVDKWVPGTEDPQKPWLLRGPVPGSWERKPMEHQPDLRTNLTEIATNLGSPLYAEYLSAIYHLEIKIRL